MDVSAVSVHCCEGWCENVNVKKCNNKLLCCCGESQTEPDPTQKKPTDDTDQVVLLNTPFVECDTWSTIDDLPFQATTLFYQDENQDLRICVHHEPPDKVQSGLLAVDVLPYYTQSVLMRIMEETLDGGFFQIHAMFKEGPRMIRSFPIFDSRNVVMSGVMVIGPCMRDHEISQFMLNDDGTIQEEPEDQSMSVQDPQDGSPSIRGFRLKKEAVQKRKDLSLTI